MEKCQSSRLCGRSNDYRDWCFHASTGRTKYQGPDSALVLAANAAKHLQVQQATFLTDNLTLATAAAKREIATNKILWELRKSLADYIHVTAGLQAQVYHISRDLNGIAHSVAHQVLNHSLEPSFTCINSAHRNRECHVISSFIKLISRDMYSML